MTTWDYRLVRSMRTDCVSIRTVFYNGDDTITAIDDEAATVIVDPRWAQGDETELTLLREELDRFALALTKPILIEMPTVLPALPTVLPALPTTPCTADDPAWVACVEAWRTAADRDRAVFDTPEFLQFASAVRTIMTPTGL